MYLIRGVVDKVCDYVMDRIDDYQKKRFFEETEKLSRLEEELDKVNTRIFLIGKSDSLKKRLDKKSLLSDLNDKKTGLEEEFSKAISKRKKYW